MKLIIGLGNPGKQYENNRHNIGFLTIIELAKKFKINSFKNKFDGLYAKTSIGSYSTLLFMPMNFMNKSGYPILQISKFYKIGLSDIIVIHDDLDLAIGKIKIKIGGGAGGHNGLSSIDNLLGKDYTRLRIGIGHPGHKNKVTNYVLSNFSSNDRSIIDPILESIVNNFIFMLEDRFSAFIEICSIIRKNIIQKNLNLEENQ